jgi:hypothetical protein
LNYYIYYKLDPERAVEARTAVHHLFDAIERQCGIRGRWLRRRDDPATYMEVYEAVEDAEAFEQLLERESAALTRKFGLQRTLEPFQCA